MNKNEEKKEGLLDKIHKCLICYSKAYECEKGHFVCSNENCKFEWRVNK